MEKKKFAPAGWGIKQKKKLAADFKSMHMCALTVTDVVKGPLFIFEEGVAFDLIHSSATQTNFPAQRRERVVRVSTESPRSVSASHTPALPSSLHH